MNAKSVAAGVALLFACLLGFPCVGALFVPNAPAPSGALARVRTNLEMAKRSIAAGDVRIARQAMARAEKLLAEGGSSEEAEVLRGELVELQAQLKRQDTLMVRLLPELKRHVVAGSLEEARAAIAAERARREHPTLPILDQLLAAGSPEATGAMFRKLETLLGNSSGKAPLQELGAALDVHLEPARVAEGIDLGGALRAVDGIPDPVERGPWQKVCLRVARARKGYMVPDPVLLSASQVLSRLEGLQFTAARTLFAALPKLATSRVGIGLREALAQRLKEIEQWERRRIQGQVQAVKDRGGFLQTTPRLRGKILLWNEAQGTALNDYWSLVPAAQRARFGDAPLTIVSIDPIARKKVGHYVSKNPRDPVRGKVQGSDVMHERSVIRVHPAQGKGSFVELVHLANPVKGDRRPPVRKQIEAWLSQHTGP